MKDLEFKIVDGGLWTEDRHSRLEDLIMLHQHLLYIYLFILCRYSRCFEDIVKL